MSDAEPPLLFSPLTVAGVTLRNRVVLSPMCQYSADEGAASPWHLAHYGKFASGGMGLVIVEAAAVEARGRITHGDLGIWSDRHLDGLRQVADVIRREGATPGIQIAHAGRKASSQRPWHGDRPLGPADLARGEAPWPIVGPWSEPVEPEAAVPATLAPDELKGVALRFAEAAARADAAGFDVLEIHAAHGYLLATFLSPTVNLRTDPYGGTRANRMRFPLEVVDAVRARWPAGKPLFCRVSAVDGAENGWSLADSVVFAAELRRRGVDVVDCSSSGLKGSGTLANTTRGPGYQVPYASAIRKEAGVMTMAVGLILDGPQAEAILQAGDADLVAIGRQAIYDPYWAQHAAQALGADDAYANWPVQARWSLQRRAALLASIGLRPV